ncbi:TPA: hypothetical protein DEP96_01160 [Candidatus Uhrbacteria bacterium]|nr:hypothetical protein [Candidatus Uhrbacteria bacterium]
MNTNTSRLASTSTTPNLLDLFRDFVATYKNWRRERFLAFIDFRELREDEITDEMRTEAAAALAAPEEDFVNI